MDEWASAFADAGAAPTSIATAKANAMIAALAVRLLTMASSPRCGQPVKSRRSARPWRAPQHAFRIWPTTWSLAPVMPGQDRGDSPEDLIDPHGRGTSFWFQQMDAPRPQRNRIHIDVWVPHDQAEARVAAAIAAGGHLVTDEHAPSWWVLADAEGNEAC